MASDVPSLKVLRDQRCDLVISPRPPEGGDILQQRLFDDTYRIFFDRSRRGPPNTIEDYLRGEHVTVLYEGQRGLEVDKVLLESGYERTVVAFVPAFSGIGSFIQGTDRLATAPSLLRRGLLRGLDSVPLPICIPPMHMSMCMIWHMQHRYDPVPGWLRAKLLSIARSIQPGA
jgi:DNA-binding transcriptional LysR family regulator